MSANLRKLIDETAEVMGPEVAACFTDGGAIKTSKKYLEIFANKLIAEFDTDNKAKTGS